MLTYARTLEKQTAKIDYFATSLPRCYSIQAELQAILPLPGDPFRKEGAQFHPLFELTLPKEHWWASSAQNELGSE